MLKPWLTKGTMTSVKKISSIENSSALDMMISKGTLGMESSLHYKDKQKNTKKT